MESINISAQLRAFLGDSICDMLQTGSFEVAWHQVVYDKTVESAKVGLFSVHGQRRLSPEETSWLRASLLDDRTWRWDLITRHQPVPEVLMELVSGEQRVVFVLDRRGGKLGFLRGQAILARDLDPGSPGAQILNRLTDEPDAGD